MAGPRLYSYMTCPRGQYRSIYMLVNHWDCKVGRAVGGGPSNACMLRRTMSLVRADLQYEKRDFSAWTFTGMKS